MAEVAPQPLTTSQNATLENALHRAELEARESEALFGELVRHSPILLYIKEVTADGCRVLRASDNFEQLVGVPGSAMVGKTNEQLFPPDFAAQMTRDDQAVVASGAVMRREEHFGGRTYATVKFPLTHGERRLLAGYTIDVTEQRAAEEHQRALERQLLQAQRRHSLGLMAGGVAHHFNNLLMIIQANLDLARERAGGEVGDWLADAQDAVRRAAAISGSMRSYLGQGENRRERVDLGTELPALWPLLRLGLPDSVRLELVLAPDLPAITADVESLRHAVLNVVTNAWEAAPAQGGVVRLTVRAEQVLPPGTGEEAPAPLGGPWVCLEVTDNGRGMDAETRERMFDPFFSTKFTGRGLGLAVTLGVVRAHGGVIDVDSEPQRGTTLRLYLPAAPPAAPAAVRPPSLKVLPPPACALRRTPGPGAVLVVDDDPLVVSATRRLLRHQGHAVLTAGSGREALELVAASPAAVGAVLLDLSMPDLDGWAVLAALRASNPGLYVVVASGYDLAELRRERRDVEPDGWLQKPFAAAELATLVPLPPVEG